MVTSIGMTAKAGQAFTYGMGIKMAAQYTTGAVTSYGVSYFGEKLGLSKTGVTMLNLGVGYLEGCAWNKGEMYLRSRKSNSHVDVNAEEPIFDKELSANAEKARTDLDIRTKAAQENSKVLGNGSGSATKIYSSVEYEGTVKVNGEVRDVSRKVYQRNDIDFNYFDETTGLTNLERMQAGKPPIGTDGNPIQLHHVLQKEAGPMAEIREVTHQEYYSQLHGLIEDGASFRNDPVLNKQYNNFRRSYWKWRANQIIGG